eukprot:gene9706-13064_t
MFLVVHSLNELRWEDSISIPIPILITILVILFAIYFARSKSFDKIYDELYDVYHLQNRDDNNPSKTKQQRLPNINFSNSSSIVFTPKSSLVRRPSYRFEEENPKRLSSEYTRRGQLWSRHASWHLPQAPRQNIIPSLTRFDSQGLEHVRAILKKFDVDCIRGFLPSQDPLQRLPYARYHLWEDLADDLPKLLGARLGQARGPLKQLPVLSTDKLVTDAELRRAHLLLCLFAHSYVWGGIEPMDTIPEGIARPLWEVSNRLGIPPVLGHTSIVLYNWRRLDSEADICMENLSTLNNFFDGRDESWFYLITVEVEARGAAAVVPMMLSMDAIQRFNEEQTVQKEQLKGSIDPIQFTTDHKSQLLYGSLDQSSDSVDAHNYISDGSEDQLAVVSCKDRYLLQASHFESDEYENDEIYLKNSDEALLGELNIERVAVYVTHKLNKIAVAIKGMVDSLDTMREGCHPFIFYHRVRPFLSAWKHNPTLPNGVLYEGVSSQRQQYYGGSAAQSCLIPFLDIGLGISHDSIKSKEFLHAMREYMLKPHREFLVYMEETACIRDFVINSLKLYGIPMTEGINGFTASKVTNKKESKMRKILIELRIAYDLCVENIKKFRTGHISLVADYIMAQQKKKESTGLESTAGGKGTGGTDLMSFLKPIRDNCGNKMLSNVNPVERVYASNDSCISTDHTPHKHRSDSLVNEDLTTPSPALHVNTNIAMPIDVLHQKGLSSPIPTASQNYEFYIKDNGCSEDIDLYRGAAGRITLGQDIAFMPMKVTGSYY